jgi:hypothetical protein
VHGGGQQVAEHGLEIGAAIEAPLELGEVARHVGAADCVEGAADCGFDVAEHGVDEVDGASQGIKVP